jgi:hypothetical protein
MANPGQPTISIGATGDVVKRLERALRRERPITQSASTAFSDRNWRRR